MPNGWSKRQISSLLTTTPFPDLPRAFVMISPWWGWVSPVVEVGRGPTRSPVPRRGSTFPMPKDRAPAKRRAHRHILSSFSLCSSDYPSPSFPPPPLSFLSCPWLELSKAPTETFVKHPHSYWLGGQRGRLCPRSSPGWERSACLPPFSLPLCFVCGKS